MFCLTFSASAVAPTDSVFSTTFLAIRWVIARFAAFGAEIWLQILARRQRICATQVRDSAAVIIPSIDSSADDEHVPTAALLDALAVEEDTAVSLSHSHCLSTDRRVTDFLARLQSAEDDGRCSLERVRSQRSFVDEQPYQPIMSSLAGKLLSNFGADSAAHETLISNIVSMGSSGLAVGSLYSGTDFAWPVLQAVFKFLAPQAEVWRLRHLFAVEWIGWKQDFLEKNHPDLQHLFGDAGDIITGFAKCRIRGCVVPVPSCDILLVGFSCKSFSALRNPSDRKYEHAIVEGIGSSGKTANYALQYVQKHRPKILLIENVVGLFKGRACLDNIFNTRR